MKAHKPEPLNLLVINDIAKRKGRNYGNIIYNQEKDKVVAAFSDKKRGYHVLLMIKNHQKKERKSLGKNTKKFLLIKNQNIDSRIKEGRKGAEGSYIYYNKNPFLIKDIIKFKLLIS